MKRSVKAPLLVTRCEGCLRRRTCAFVPFKAGFKHPLCRQCIKRTFVSCMEAGLEFGRQGR